MDKIYRFFDAIFIRNVATSIAIAIPSFTAVAAIVSVGIHHHSSSNREVETKETEVISESVTISVQSDTIRPVEGDKTEVAGTIVFDDELLETILNNIAEYYGHEVVFNNEASKSLRLYFRWNRALTVEEVVERLNNFEQIRLTVNDNTIKAD